MEKFAAYTNCFIGNYFNINADLFFVADDSCGHIASM